VLGRLASQTAVLLRGKHKPTFAPHVDTGDFVIIINAEKVALTGNKAQQKRAYRHSGFPGGLSSMSYAELLDKFPEGRREGRARHAPQELPRSPAADQAQGLHRRRAPPRGPEARALRDHPGGPVMTADNTTDVALDVDEPELSEYTTETDAPSRRAASRPSSAAPGAATGRRKQAIARVRIVPGTGEWTINGRTLENYFPNKVHQQIVNEPLKVLELDGAYDVLVRVHGGGPSGQAGAVRLGVARSLNGVDEELNRPALKKAGFLTRDARVPERKKAGLKKARKAPQYSKR
jgi:small subunit ribosomal protein S9